MSLPIAFVQGAGTAGAGSTATVTSGALTTTSQNTLIIGLTENITTADTWTITDTYGNTWVKLGTSQVGTFQQAFMYAAFNITGGASHTVTAVTTGSTPNLTIHVAEFSGIGRQIKSNTVKGGTGTAGTATTGASGVTNYNQELVFAVIVDTFGDTLVKDAAYTTAVAQFAAAANTYITSSEYKIITSAGAQTATYTGIGGASNWTIYMATFPAQVSSSRSNIRPHPFSPGLAR